jgi:hypothetical protein
VLEVVNVNEIYFIGSFLTMLSVAQTAVNGIDIYVTYLYLSFIGV